MSSCLYLYIFWLSTCVGFLSASRIFMSAPVGSSAVLLCHFTPDSSQKPHIEWRTFSETVFERRGAELFVSEDYKGRVDVPEDKLQKGNCSLVLKEVKADDAGVYESYLMVQRTKRALGSKRVFLQSVELSVNEINESSLSRQDTPPELKDAGNAGMVQTPSYTVALILLPLFQIF